MDNNIDKKWPLFTPELTKFLSWVSVKRAGWGGGRGGGKRGGFKHTAGGCIMSFRKSPNSYIS